MNMILSIRSAKTAIADMDIFLLVLLTSTACPSSNQPNFFHSLAQVRVANTSQFFESSIRERFLMLHKNSYCISEIECNGSVHISQVLCDGFFHCRSVDLADNVEIAFDTKSWDVFVVVVATHNANARPLNTCDTQVVENVGFIVILESRVCGSEYMLYIFHKKVGRSRH